MYSAPGTAEAKSRWHPVGNFKAGGDGKEVTVERQISAILIRCTEGSVIINTIVLREGGNKNPIAVTARLNAGEDKIVDIGGARMVNGLRVGDDGKGTYTVFVK